MSDGDRLRIASPQDHPSGDTQGIAEKIGLFEDVGDKRLTGIAEHQRGNFGTRAKLHGDGDPGVFQQMGAAARGDAIASDEDSSHATVSQVEPVGRDRIPQRSCTPLGLLQALRQCVHPPVSKPRHRTATNRERVSSCSPNPGPYERSRGRKVIVYVNPTTSSNAPHQTGAWRLARTVAGGCDHSSNPLARISTPYKASSSPTKNHTGMIRWRSIRVYQNIHCRIRRRTAETPAQKMGRWKSGMSPSFGSGVTPYTRPTNSEAGFGLVARLTSTVTITPMRQDQSARYMSSARAWAFEESAMMASVAGFIFTSTNIPTDDSVPASRPQNPPAAVTRCRC